MAAPWLAVGAALLVTKSAVGRVRERRRTRHIARVSGHVPILGRVKTIQEGGRGRILDTWDTIAAEADAQDAPMMKMTMLGMTTIVCTSPEVANALLRKPKYVPKYAAPYKLFRWLGTNSPSIVDTHQEEHTHLRKAFGSFFNAENIQSVVERMVDEVALVCDGVRDRALQGSRQQGSGPDGGDGNVAVEDVSQLAMHIIEEVVKKVFFETEVKVDYDAVSRQLMLMGQNSFNPINTMLIRNRLSPTYFTKYRPNWRRMRASWEALARDTFNKPDDANSTAFWACLQRAFPNALNDPYQWERAITNTGGIYFAGSETTAQLIAIALAALAVDPNSLARLEEELRQAGLLMCEENPKPRLPKAQDLTDLTFLNAVFCEGLRMFPTAPNGTVRQLETPLKTAKGTVPAHLPVFIPPWAIHHRTQVWGEDAREWRPARWLEGRSANALKKDADGFLRWLPFSDGVQNCIGSHIATLETKLALAMFVSRFHISPSPKLQATSISELLATATSFVTLHQKNGVFLSLQPRSSSS